MVNFGSSVYDNLKIMFPMIATVDEFRQAKAILLEEKISYSSNTHSLINNIFEASIRIKKD